MCLNLWGSLYDRLRQSASRKRKSKSPDRKKDAKSPSPSSEKDRSPSPAKSLVKEKSKSRWPIDLFRVTFASFDQVNSTHFLKDNIILVTLLHLFTRFTAFILITYGQSYCRLQYICLLVMFQIPFAKTPLYADLSARFCRFLMKFFVKSPNYSIFKFKEWKQNWKRHTNALYIYACISVLMTWCCPLPCSHKNNVTDKFSGLKYACWSTTWVASKQ